MLPWFQAFRCAFKTARISEALSTFSDSAKSDVDPRIAAARHEIAKHVTRIDVYVVGVGVGEGVGVINGVAVGVGVGVEVATASGVIGVAVGVDVRSSDT